MVNNNDDDPNKGTVELHSYHCPSLSPGEYTVSVDHDIIPPAGNGEKAHWHSERKFSVVGPRFSIPDRDVNSIYPIKGQEEEARVLPHIVFNSPHLPWETPIDTWKDGDTNRTPWLALIPFTRDELHNSLIDHAKTGHPALTSSLAYETTVAYLAEKHDKTLFPNITSEDSFSEEEKKHPVSFISLTPDKFLELFGNQGALAQGEHNLGLERFKYFAHARTLNVQGTTLHPIAESARHKSFGVVISHRCAPLNITKDETVYVHLVSLDRLKNITASQGKITGFQTSKMEGIERVSIVSLRSWTYQAMPPGGKTFAKLLDDLNEKKQPLRRLDKELKDLSPSTNPSSISAQNWLATRLANGYTFVHHRTYSGERTVAIYRGPLVPGPPVRRRTTPSTVGMDLQIFDRQTGMMDISYSVAWELGRTLASADRAFTAAMMKLRSECLDLAFLGGSTRKKDVLADLKTLNEDKLEGYLIADQTKFILPPDTSDPSNASGSTPRVRTNVEILEYGLVNTVRKWLADAVKVRIDFEAGRLKRGSANTIPSTWNLILNWVKSKLMLNDIPTTHLFPDPAVLQDECLRTFYIDRNWLEAFVDGALSLANHTTYLNDPIKREIKGSINEYLKKTSEEFELEKATPPRWGFIFRSQIVQAYPNLIIRQVMSDSTEGQQPSNAQPGTTTSHTTFMGQPVIRAMGDKTLMFLQSQTAEEPQRVKSIRISQPHHHQRFSIGDTLDTKELTFTFNSYSGDEPERDPAYLTIMSEPGSSTVQTKQLEGRPIEIGSAIFDWETRCILVRGFLEACAAVPGIFPGPHGWMKVTSALCALQLNDGIHELHLSFANAKTPPGTGTLIALSNPGDSNKPPDPPVSSNQENPKPAVAQVLPASVKTRFGFDTTHLDKVASSGPNRNDFKPGMTAPASLSTTLLNKYCYPLIDPLLLGRNIPVPVPEPIELDLIFSITAPQNIYKDASLESIIVSIPLGKEDTNILQSAPARLSIRMIGKNQRWTYTSTQVDKKLSITIKPRKDSTASPDQALYLARDLSFVLQRTRIQSGVCNSIEVPVVENYVYKNTKVQIKDRIVVQKQQCNWVKLN